MEGKTARACDACMRRRARWFCAANDTFLCQSCDSSILLTNQLARRHERVRLRTCDTSSSFSLSSSVQSPTKKTPGDVTETPVWYEGFTKKARTPRSLLGKSLQSKKAVNVFVNDDFGLDLNSNFNLNDPLVPELGSEEGSFSFSSVDENEENLNCRVPVFDFPDMEIEVKDNNNSFGFSLDSQKIDGGDLEEEEMDDGLNGFLPLDIDLAEFSMDVESLLGEESGVDVRESGVFEFKEDENIEVNIDLALKSVKNEEGVAELEEDFRWNLDYGSSVLGRKREEVELKGKIKNDGLRSDDNNGEEEELVNEKAKKKSVFLRLDYEAVMTAWDSQCSPWTTGFRPEFRSCDCWPDCLLQGFMCPIHVLNGSEEATAVGSILHQQVRGGGGSDSEREARVLRYKEKRRTRLFAKKIRYEVRKLNAEKRPRIKGRFVKRTSLLAAVS